MKTIRKTDILKVILSAIIVEDGFNVRENLGEEDGSLDALAKQIAAQGQKQPLKGIRKGDTVVLTAGHRRLAAINIANEKYGADIKEALVMTEKADTKTRVFEMLIDGDGSKPLTNKEMVKGIKRLLDMGVKKKEIVTNLGMSKSQAQAYNLVAAAKAPDSIIKMIDKGEISVAKVNALQRKATDSKELEELAKDFVANADKPKAPKVSADVAKLEDALELAPKKSAKAANLKAIVNKLKAKASAEDIAKLLK